MVRVAAVGGGGLGQGGNGGKGNPLARQADASYRPNHPNRPNRHGRPIQEPGHSLDVVVHEEAAGEVGRAHAVWKLDRPRVEAAHKRVVQVGVLRV